MQRTLRDKSLNEDLRAKKYNWMYKQRRQLKEDINKRPQRVLMVDEKGQALSSAPAPHLGVNQINPSLLKKEQESTIPTVKIVKERVIRKKANKTPAGNLCGNGFFREELAYSIGQTN